MRIGIVDRAQLEPIDPHVAAVFENAIERLSDTFGSNETVRLPLDLSEYQRLSGEIMAFEAYRRLRGLVEDESTPLDPFVRQSVLSFVDDERSGLAGPGGKSMRMPSTRVTPWGIAIRSMSTEAKLPSPILVNPLLRTARTARPAVSRGQCRRLR